jgi:predicted nuclease of predicted toxin-antitoxin system
MKISIDMKLSPGWVETLAAQGWDTVHWSSMGDIRWACENAYAVFTHDL